VAGSNEPRRVSGTDAMAGFAFDGELELHVMAGIPRERVLQDATLGAARLYLCRF
jgi:hypothetical protein